MSHQCQCYYDCYQIPSSCFQREREDALRGKGTQGECRTYKDIYLLTHDLGLGAVSADRE